jgi:hypothetical protein
MLFKQYFKNIILKKKTDDEDEVIEKNCTNKKNLLKL